MAKVAPESRMNASKAGGEAGGKMRYAGSVWLSDCHAASQSKQARTNRVNRTNGHLFPCPPAFSRSQTVVVSISLFIAAMLTESETSTTLHCRSSCLHSPPHFVPSLVCLAYHQSDSPPRHERPYEPSPSLGLSSTRPRSRMRSTLLHQHSRSRDRCWEISRRRLWSNGRLVCGLD